MEFAQRRVIQVQTALVAITLLMFFVPYGEILEFDSYLISDPYSLIYIFITLVGLLFGLVSNAKHEASFKSAYFLGSLFFPLMWGINSAIEFFDLLIFWDFYYPNGLIIAAISFVIVGIYVFYGLYYNDPLDWTSHKVDKFSVQFKPVSYGFLGLITFILFIMNLYINSLIYQNDLADTYFVEHFNSLPIPFVWYLIIGALLVLLMNSGLLVVFRDRLYFFIPLTLATTTSQWAFNTWEIKRVLENVSTVNFEVLVDAGFLLIFTTTLYVVLPIFLFAVSLLIHQKNKFNLVPFVLRSNSVTSDVQIASTDSSASFDNQDSDYIADGYNDHETKSTSFQSNLNHSSSSNTLIGGINLTRSMLFMVFVHFVSLVLFVIGYNLNIYNFSEDGDSIRFSFGELLELIEIFEIFADSANASLLLGIYVFVIFVAQIVLMLLQLKLAPSFKNYGFIGLIIINGFHLLTLIIGFILIGFPVNDLNEAFGYGLTHRIGLGVVIQFVILVVSVVLYTQGDNYLPQIFESLNNLDLSFASTGQNANRAQFNRPAPRPAPTPGSRPAPRLEPVPGSRPGRPAPRPAPISRPETSPVSNVAQEASTISSLESNLAALKRLFDEGLITEDEYAAKKKQLLDKL